MNKEVGSKLLELVHRHAVQIRIPGALVVCVMGYLLMTNIDASTPRYWFAFAILIQLLRPLALKKVAYSTQYTLRNRLIFAGILSVMNGTSLGITVLFFPQLDLANLMVISLLLVGAAGASSTTNGGYPPLYLCFVLPALLPLTLTMLTDPGHQLGQPTSLTIAMLSLTMIIVMTRLGTENFNTFSALVELSDRQTLMSAELSDALRSAESEKQRAIASNHSKTRFLASASHDLRQPVHVVALCGAALETMAETEKLQEVVGDMNSAVQSLSKQLNELLDIAKLDSNSVTPQLQPLDLKMLVSMVTDEFQREAAMRGIVIVNSVDDDLYAYSDITMLSQMLRNVIGNAIKYTHKGSVNLLSQRDQHIITLSVQDTGIGMNENETQHIFEEFFQINNPERNREKGIGLGLSIVERLATSLEHDLSIKSSPGIGTCVSIHMKAIDLAEAELHLPSFTGNSITAIESFNCWVHIVDDDQSVRKSMKILLHELGCKVTSTASTDDTVSFITHSSPDIFFIDLRLNGSDSGVNTLKAIKERCPHARRVIITGEIDVQLDDESLSTVSEVLHKPVRKSQVSELLSATCAEKQSVSDQQLIHSSTVQC